jgi:hypothetical protein
MHAFALGERELAAELEALPEDGAPRAAPLPPMQAGPARTSALLLLRGVLQQRAAAMAATGSAEQDGATLHELAAPSSASSLSAPQQQRLHAALLYRQAQKRIAAGYLAVVRDMLARDAAR